MKRYPKDFTTGIVCPPFPDPELYSTFHLTFTSYGSWLLGDQRGSTRHGNIRIDPCYDYEQFMRERLIFPKGAFNTGERAIVAHAFWQACRLRQWTLHAQNVRTQHVHLLLTTQRGWPVELVRREMKTAATKALRRRGLFVDRQVWTRGGGDMPIGNRGYFCNAFYYVLNQ